MHPNILYPLKNSLYRTYVKIKLKEFANSNGINWTNKNIDMLIYILLLISILYCYYESIYSLDALHYGGGWDKIIEFLSFFINVFTNIFFFCYFNIFEKYYGSFFFYFRRKLFKASFSSCVTILCNIYFLVFGCLNLKVDVWTPESYSSGVSRAEVNIV